MSSKEHESDVHNILMVISPAKTLDLTPLADTIEFEWSQPCCNEIQTQQIASSMKSRNEADLCKLLSISKNLASVAHKYWAEFKVDERTVAKLQKPCIFIFDGPAYQGIDASSCSQSSMAYLQQHLRIIDPLYGCLKPLDLIQPYRLEMAAKNVLPGIKDLSVYWKESVTDYIAKSNIYNNNNNNKTPCFLINLASEEYFAAVEPKILSTQNIQVVKIIFQQDGRIISTHAKRARGLMVRYLANEGATSLEQVKKFQMEGYKLESDECYTFVFNRRKNNQAKISESHEFLPSKRKKTK